MAALSKALPGHAWRGWWFWRVTTGDGAIDPVTVANTWPLAEVVEYALNLTLRGILEDI
jgi:hypothetical protein